jgi:DNA ligase 1
MNDLAQLGEHLSQTTRKTAKLALLAEYFSSRSVADAAFAAVFLSGRPFPAHEAITLNVGGALLSRALVEVSGASGARLNAAYRRHGDLGSAAYDLLEHRPAAADGLTLSAVESYFRRIAAASGLAVKGALVRELLARATAIEAKYIVKIMTGDLRIGLRESLVEEAIAKAFTVAHADVRRANMLLGDIGATLQLAAERRLGEARMRLFHPIGMMLASPVESSFEAFAYFDDALVEDKYDGIRAQVHSDGSTARLFSRTLEDVTASFPELAAALARRLTEPAIIDGEILAWRDGRALPFSALQPRLGRKLVTADLIRAVPVAYVAFDVLYVDGELRLEEPLRQRAVMLDSILHSLPEVNGDHLVSLPEKRSSRRSRDQASLFASPVETEAVPLPPLLRSPMHTAHSAGDLDRLFDEAQARGNEGLMIKDARSPYLPGRRGRSWLKLKRELATLDVVVTAVEWGHGKRAAVLSDVTFAVRDRDRLLNVGKAYSGLTDAEIAELTGWFLAHTLADHGHVRTVEPKIVLEVAFNNVMESERHESGFALRFPRILRLRPDKPVAEIDTLDRVRTIFQSQPS